MNAVRKELEKSMQLQKTCIKRRNQRQICQTPPPNCRPEIFAKEIMFD